MTQPLPDGHGGSYLVTDTGVVKQKGSTLNPGDAGYAEALAKVKVHDEERKGTFKRVASFADLNEQPQPEKPKAATPPPLPARATPSQGDK